MSDSERSDLTMKPCPKIIRLPHVPFFLVNFHPKTWHAENKVSLLSFDFTSDYLKTINHFNKSGILVCLIIRTRKNTSLNTQIIFNKVSPCKWHHKNCMILPAKNPWASFRSFNFPPISSKNFQTLQFFENNLSVCLEYEQNYFNKKYRLILKAISWCKNVRLTFKSLIKIKESEFEAFFLFCFSGFLDEEDGISQKKHSSKRPGSNKYSICEAY